MSSRNLCASILTICVLAVGIGGLAPAANAASPGQSLLNPGESAGNNVIEVTRRGYGRYHRPRIHLPIGPSYLYYDYPYYYSRGYYPTHIGPGYVYDYPEGYDSDSDYAGDEGTPYSAEERCARRFKSFDWDTGRYTTYGGHTKLCPYLR